MFNWFKKRKAQQENELDQEIVAENSDIIEELPLIEEKEIEINNDTIDEVKAPNEKEIKEPQNQEKYIEKTLVELLQSESEHNKADDNTPYSPELDLPDYKYPTLDLLQDRYNDLFIGKSELENNKNIIIQTLKTFGVEIRRISVTVGPTFTLYEVVPEEGNRYATIKNLKRDIELALSANSLNIVPIPNHGTVGLAMLNNIFKDVTLYSIISKKEFIECEMPLPIALGRNIYNEDMVLDLSTMPHLLLVGATGQGKSNTINAILISLLYKKHPSQLKFILIDLKKVELHFYQRIEKHFLAKLPDEDKGIVTDIHKAVATLNSVCIEMDNRYGLLKEARARNIKEYNEKFISRRLNPERGHKYLPFLVLVIDEFSELINLNSDEINTAIDSLTKRAHSVGIHLVIATTSRSTVNIITRNFKTNFSTRIAFTVNSKIDLSSILDEDDILDPLLRPGDIYLYYKSNLQRLQCSYIDLPDIERVIEYIGIQKGYSYDFELPEYKDFDYDNESKVVDLVNRDKLFEDCARVVVQTQSGSHSMLQRRFNLGYNRAGRIMDQLEAAGIVGYAMGSKPRDVIFKTEAELEQFLKTLD